jgi:Protein of unknown function (DUF2778)
MGNHGARYRQAEAGIVPGGWWVSKSRVALTRVALAGQNRKKSFRKAVSCNLLAGVAIACLALGCGWAVYSNIFSASVYPTLGSADYDEPAVKPAPWVATRSATQAVSDAFASFPAPAKREVVASITPAEFDDRFGASAPTGVASRAAEAAPPEALKIVEAPKPAGAAQIAEVLKHAPKPRAAAQLAMNEPPAAPLPVETRSAEKSNGVSLRDMAERAKIAMMSIASGGKSSMIEKLWGKRGSAGPVLAYASADASVTASISPAQNPMNGGSAPYDRDTAVYDISAHAVYLPDGTKLEAHSGLGSELDDPRSARIRMRGVTPPHIYELTPREALFHGVPALRLNPIGGENAIYGRAGLLAHTYMLGPNGDSNGCVSFKDYYAFLNAYRNMGIRKLAVVARID